MTKTDKIDQLLLINVLAWAGLSTKARATDFLVAAAAHYLLTVTRGDIPAIIEVGPKQNVLATKTVVRLKFVYVRPKPPTNPANKIKPEWPMSGD